MLREHVAGCGECDVDLPTMTGDPCDDARELAEIDGVEITPRHECVANSDDPCDNCRALAQAAATARQAEVKAHHLAKFRRACRMLAELAADGFTIYVAGSGTFNLMAGPTHDEQTGRALRDNSVDYALVPGAGGGDW
jgi:hypothetical protein